MAFRFIERDDMEFYENVRHRRFVRPSENNKHKVYSAKDIDSCLTDFFESNFFDKKKGLLLSGGMDSGILASYMPGCDAYTFRYLGGDLYKDELARAELFARINRMKLHYIDIDWDTTVEGYLDKIMIAKGEPVHSIEPQIMQAACSALNDDIDVMIIGAGSDDVFGGIDKLLSKDWKYDEFKRRFMYTDPDIVLNEPVDMDYAFEPWKRNVDDIDYMGFLDANSTLETDLSFYNAFLTAGLDYFDPYIMMEMGEPLDLYRIRHGESKYLIRELFRMKYQEIPVPEKLPMPRPVDLYFQNWQGPVRHEFKENLNMDAFTGNQKWQMWCLERFLNLME